MKIIIVLQLVALAMPVAANAAAPAGPHKSKAPIEITSDALEVLQQENKAIFTGHVVAIQEDTRLQSDKMTVFYKKTADVPGQDKPKKPDVAAAPNDGSKDAIQHIDVEGNVFVSTPEETASGARGDYDVERHEIHLFDHVVLTKGQNVLKGDTLTYNFETGKSVVTSNVAGEKTIDNKGKQRVRAVFIPENNDKKK